MSIRPFLASVALPVFFACSSCSSDDSASSTPPAQDDGGVATPEADASTTAVDDGASRSTDAVTSQAPSDGGREGAAIDIAHSAECFAYCAKASKCAPCQPAADCAAPADSCDEAQRAYLKCEADTGQFVCGNDGFAVVSSCHRDNSVCPKGMTSQDAEATCKSTPPDGACTACLQANCKNLYDMLMSNPELSDFRACVTDCETACFPPNVCPSECAASISAYYDYTNLLQCGNIACYHDRADVGPNVCKPTTVIF
jgi:hypothetical protein